MPDLKLQIFAVLGLVFVPEMPSKSHGIAALILRTVSSSEKSSPKKLAGARSKCIATGGARESSHR
jgi:hypothetical protein